MDGVDLMLHPEGELPASISICCSGFCGLKKMVMMMKAS